MFDDLKLLHISIAMHVVLRNCFPKFCKKSEANDEKLKENIKKCSGS